MMLVRIPDALYYVSTLYTHALGLNVASIPELCFQVCLHHARARWFHKNKTRLRPTSILNFSQHQLTYHVITEILSQLC